VERRKGLSLWASRLTVSIALPVFSSLVLENCWRVKKQSISIRSLFNEPVAQDQLTPGPLYPLCVWQTDRCSVSYLSRIITDTRKCAQTVPHWNKRFIQSQNTGDSKNSNQLDQSDSWHTNQVAWL